MKNSWRFSAHQESSALKTVRAVFPNEGGQTPLPAQLVSDAVGNARAEQRRLRNALALAGFVSCAGDALGDVLGARAGLYHFRCLQVFVGKEQISRAFGQTNLKSVSFATGLGAASSSCSYAAVAAARSAMQQGAALIPALAFMFASTNLVIE